MQTRSFLLLFVFLVPSALQAELLVYEGFDPSDPGVSLDSGRLAGATSKGFAAESTWDVAGGDDYTAEFTEDGLSMEGLVSTGGAVEIGVGGSSRAGGVNVFRQSGVSVPPGSTIYGSFLFQNNQAESRYLTSFKLETGENLPDDRGSSRGAHRIADNDAAALVAISPDSFARDEEGVPGRATQGIKVGKYASHGSKEMAQSDYDLPNGETFLVVWSIANTAGSEAAAGGGQQVVMWILSQDNLTAIRAAGDATQEMVDANHLVRVVVDKGLRGRLLDTDFLNLGATIAGGNKQSSSKYDELRIGTSMAAVLPAP
jgi:hypothetical protein